MGIFALELGILILLGYMSGSVLYAQIFLKLFKREEMLADSRDRNPGTANAFLYGGFWCGVLTLVCDVLKGFIPVYFFMRLRGVHYPEGFTEALAVAAPVIGHTFPLFYGFKGGKGIATSFGCLAGMFPLVRPLAALAFFFIFFSVVLRVTPHFQRTLVVYLCTLTALFIAEYARRAWMSFLPITAAVFIRMLASKEEKEKMEVRLLWRH